MTRFLQFFFHVVLSFTLINCSSGDRKQTSSLNGKNDEDSSSVKSLKLIFVGDIMQHSVQIRSAYDPQSGLFDYEPCFRYVSPLFAKADFVIANLELSLNDKNDYSGYPAFKAPDALVSYLKSAGFNVLITANNHINDNGKYGLLHTLDVLDSFKIKHSGSFRDATEREQKYPLLLEKNIEGVNFRIALLSYTYGTNGRPAIKPTIVNLIDTNQIKIDLLKAKNLKSDFVIVCMHWGQEYQINQHKTQEILTKWLWQNGVDVVVGSHPHVIQPIISDTINSAEKATSKQVLCAYSLGNFISNQFNPPLTNMGLMYEVELLKSASSGKKQLGKHYYIPLFCYIHNQKKSVSNWVYNVVPVSAFISDSTNFLSMPKAKQKEMQKDYAVIQKHLNKFGAIEKIINYSDIIKQGTMPPDSVITILPRATNPNPPRIRRYKPTKKSKK